MSQNVNVVAPSFFLRLFGKIQSVPMFKFAFFKFMYGVISRASIKEKEMVFMNYGYSRQGFDERVDLQAADEQDRYSIQLYEYLVDGESLTGKELLEVGCGRGGGVSYMARYKSPALVTGLDLSNTQVKFCIDRHPLENVKFVQGSALQLPFDDGSFDAVINVESSHCYPSLADFFGEVFRVLKPGAKFYYADFIPQGSSESDPRITQVIESKLQEAGFDLLKVDQITDEVINALEHTDAQKQKMFAQQLSSSVMSRTTHDLLGTKGSRTFELFKEKESIYYAIRARKPLNE